VPEFEVFKKRMVRPTEQPHVAIQRRGVFSINKAAYEALGSPGAVELLYAEDEKIVGLRASTGNAEYAYPLRPTQAKSDTTFMASGQAFTNYYGIVTTTSRRWAAYMDGDILCIDLKQPGTEIIGNRRPNGQKKEPIDYLPGAPE
jgi:hypothetical protein